MGTSNYSYFTDIGVKHASEIPVVDYAYKLNFVCSLLGNYYICKGQFTSMFRSLCYGLV